MLTAYQSRQYHWHSNTGVTHMTYICHDTASTARASAPRGWLSEFADWVNVLFQRDKGETIDPRNEHLMRDAGLHPAPRMMSISDQLPYSMMGTSIHFIDLFLAGHIDRAPTRRR
jgi:hypothetical protein